MMTVKNLNVRDLKNSVVNVYTCGPHPGPGGPHEPHPGPGGPPHGPGPRGILSNEKEEESLNTVKVLKLVA